MPNTSPEMEIIEKLTDSHITTSLATAQKLTSIETNIATITNKVNDINKGFHNGFRSELKKYIDDKIVTKLDEVNDKVDKINSIGFWVKNIGILLGSIAVIVAGLMKILSE